MGRFTIFRLEACDYAAALKRTAGLVTSSARGILYGWWEARRVWPVPQLSALRRQIHFRQRTFLGRTLQVDKTDVNPGTLSGSVTCMHHAKSRFTKISPGITTVRRWTGALRSPMPDQVPIKRTQQPTGRYLRPCAAQEPLRTTSCAATTRFTGAHAGVHATCGIEWGAVQQPNPRAFAAAGADCR